jgi:hypothetical protein
VVYSRTYSDFLCTDQVPPDNVPYNSDSEDDIDEEAYDLRDVSSDVEVNLDEVELDSDDDDAEYARSVNPLFNVF